MYERLRVDRSTTVDRVVDALRSAMFAGELEPGTPLREQPLATDIARDLRLDAGYLSRILRGFERRGLIRRVPSEIDARRSLLELTRPGRQELARLNRVTDEQVGTLLAPLKDTDRGRLLECMRTIEQILG